MRVVAAVLSGLMLALTWPIPSDDRLRVVLGVAPQRGLVMRPGSLPVAHLAAAMAGVGTLAVVGMHPIGCVAATAVALGANRLLLILTRRPSPQSAGQLLADAPLAFDLMAACIAAGATPDSALRGVADAVDGPLGQLLGSVAHAAALGCPADQAWAPLLSPDMPPPLRDAATGFVRAERSGAALAPALERIAADQRRACRVAAQAAARRAGVLAVGPLGLCFLPAFVLVGVVPLVAGLVSEVSL